MCSNSFAKVGVVAAVLAVGELAAGVMAQPVPKARPMSPGSSPAEKDPLSQQLGGPTDDPMGPGFDLNWYTIDGGGATFMVGGGFSFGTTAGQPDAGLMTGGDFELGGGFWYGAIPNAPCYANCDDSTLVPFLNVNDFQCFLNRFAANDPYANCDQSTLPPVLNVNDFQCFLNTYALGCP